MNKIPFVLFGVSSLKYALQTSAKACKDETRGGWGGDIPEGTPGKQRIKPKMQHALLPRLESCLLTCF